VIVGIGLSDYPKAPHLSAVQHHAQALQRALADAGLVAPIDINLGEGSLDEMCLEIFGILLDAPAQPPSASLAAGTLELPAFGAIPRLFRD